MRTALALVLVLAPVQARAQLIATSFEELPTALQQGERIQVITAGGDTVKGDALDVSSSGLELRIRTPKPEGSTPASRARVLENDVREIRREHRDRLWNGTLIGLAAIAFPGAVTIANGLHSANGGYPVDTELVAAGIVMLGIGAGIGAAVDASIHRRTTVYLRLRGQEVATTFEDLRRIVRVDEPVFVTDSAGVTHKGRLASLSASSLQLREISGPWTAFTERDVNNVAAVRRDPLWNGMAIGFAVGATPIALVGAAASVRGSDVAAVSVAYGTIGLLTGLLIDVVNKQTVPIYIHPPQPASSRVLLAPIYSRGRSGLQLVAAF